MLYSSEIRQILEQKQFREKYVTRIVCGCNELPLVVGYRPAVYIINTIPTFTSSIGHWIMCIFGISLNGRRTLFFDPLGHHYSMYDNKIGSFMEHNSDRITISLSYPVQSDQSIMCGEYCLFFLAMLVKGIQVCYIVEKLKSISENRMLEQLNASLHAANVLDA